MLLGVVHDCVHSLAWLCLSGNLLVSLEYWVFTSFILVFYFFSSRGLRSLHLSNRNDLSSIRE
ncbi:hypothetical protein Hanom_Chr12g01100591 [Helianthus anomalus]